jgi:hypothetical protein
LPAAEMSRIDPTTSEGSFLNGFSRLRKSWRLCTIGAKLALAPPFHRRQLAPRRNLTHRTSFKKLPSEANPTTFEFTTPTPAL